MGRFRELFEIEGWKKYSLALMALIIGGVALPTKSMSGAEFVALVGVITAFFGASDVGSKWVGKNNENPQP